MLKKILLIVNCTVQLGPDFVLAWPIEVASGRKDQPYNWQEPFPGYTIHCEPHFDPTEMGMVIRNLPVIAHLRHHSDWRIKHDVLITRNGPDHNVRAVANLTGVRDSSDVNSTVKGMVIQNLPAGSARARSK